jgi:hypothetical protein
MTTVLILRGLASQLVPMVVMVPDHGPSGWYVLVMRVVSISLPVLLVLLILDLVIVVGPPPLGKRPGLTP